MGGGAPAPIVTTHRAGGAFNPSFSVCKCEGAFRELTLRFGWVRQVRHPADTRNFETYPDVPEDPNAAAVLIDSSKMAEIFEAF